MLLSMKQDFISAAKETPLCWFHVVYTSVDIVTKQKENIFETAGFVKP